LVLGDYIPGRSDIDLLLVVESPLTAAELESLVEAATKEQPPSRVDLRVVTAKTAACPSPMPLLEPSITLSPQGVHVEPRGPERDLVVELSICRAHGRSLVGPAPAELIGEVPDDWVLAVGDAQLADWEAIGDDRTHAQLTVLTTCRVWRYAEERIHCSKDAAGEWALERDSALEAVRAALDQRHVDPDIRIDWPEIRRLLGIVRARLKGVPKP
jgi:Domain of unknown function (DUF4111)